MHHHLPHIAIIGAGFTGTSLAVALSETLPTPSAISLIDARGTFGPGLAYGASDPCCVVNSPAAKISVFGDRPGHFAEWLAKHEPEVAAAHRDGFVPRAVYGRYLQDVLEAAISRSDIAISRVWAQVIAIEREGSRYRLRLSAGQSLVANVVAFCTGYGPPASRSDGGDRVVTDPWGDWVDRVDPSDRVVFRGSGLTMVDQALRLQSRGHRGPVTAVSRRGLLPRGHTREPVAARSLGEAPAGLRPALRAVRGAVAAEGQRGGDWRSLIDGLRPAVQALWRHLPPAEQAMFLRHLRPYWDVHRHRTAPAVGEWVQGELASGRLAVRAGRIIGADPGPAGVGVVLRARHAQHDERIEAEWYVDCAGTDAAIGAGVLDWSLLGMGVAGRSDDDRVAMRIADGATLVDGRGEPVRGLYALGPPGRGRLWEITAIPEIRDQVQEVAMRIVSAVTAGITAADGVDLAAWQGLNNRVPDFRRL